jgi:beta-glucosidase
LLSPLVGLMKAHAAAYHALHDEAQKAGKTVRVGMAHHLRIYDPKTNWNPADIYAASIMDQLGNWALVEALETGTFKIDIPFLMHAQETIPGLAQTQDYIGLNYYSRDHVSFSLTSSDHIETTVLPGEPVNDLGWEIYPYGMYRILKEIPRHVRKMPIIVTENGIADAKDTQRKQFIEDHLYWMNKAMSEGADVEGYCHWSVYDNFEWDNGYTARFGLYEVNYTNQVRTLRASGARYGEIAGKNGFYY